MTTNKVEIELELSGADEAVESLEGIGETASAMADRFQQDNSHLGEGLGDLTGNVGDALESVKGLGAAFTAQGASMMSLLGPIGAVVAAGFALYETFLNISGAAEEAEEAEANMAAASSDLQSKLEALAEKGVIPSVKALADFTEATLLAQFAKDDLETTMTKKLTPAMKVHQRELKRMRDLQEKAREADNMSAEAAQKLGREIVAQDTVVQRSREKLNKAASVFRQAQLEVIHLIKDAAEQEEAFEKLSAESRLAVIKENAAKLDALRLMQKQSTSSEEQAKIFEVQQKKARALKELQVEANKENIKFLKQYNDELEASIKTLDAKAIIEAASAKDVADIQKQAADKAKAEQEKNIAQRQARRAAARAKRLAKEKQLEGELRQIRSLEIESARINGASVLEVLDMRYQEELKAAGKNANLKLIAEMRYQNNLNKIASDAEKKREQDKKESDERIAEQERARAEQRANLIFDSMEFDANLAKDETEKQLRLLELRYAREIQLNASTQEEITELNRRQAIERQQITSASIDAQVAKIGEFASSYGAGLAEATYSALLFGESFTKAIGSMLVGLGRQAAVQSLMELAKGTAALFIPGAQATAAGHFKASALFAGASAAAGVAGKAMGGGGSATGGGGGATSPTGTPQTAAAPERERAEETGMVFNINFGGAVIYDTQRAAEQALADRITNLQNTRRRGAPRRAF